MIDIEVVYEGDIRCQVQEEDLPTGDKSSQLDILSGYLHVASPFRSTLALPRLSQHHRMSLASACGAGIR